MSRQFFIKTSLVLGISALFVFGLDVYMLRGGMILSKAGIVTSKIRPAAAMEFSETMSKNGNVRVLMITAMPESPDGFFRKGNSIKIDCVLENASKDSLSNFKSVLRTHTVELQSLRTKVLKSSETVRLSGTFKPESTGQVFVACRTDVDDHIAEAYESDNSAMKTLYILP